VAVVPGISEPISPGLDFITVSGAFVTAADMYQRGRNDLYHAEVTVNEIDSFGADWLLEGWAETTPHDVPPDPGEGTLPVTGVGAGGEELAGGSAP